MRRIALAILALAMSACAHAPIPESEGHLKKPPEPPPAGNIPPPVQISTILPEPKPRLRPETYTVVVNGVKVQELLFALARDAKLNVDIHSGITGVVTLNAIDQTLPQLLTRISKQVDMRWELDGPNLAVMPDSPYLHIYQIDYVNMERLVAGAVGVSSQIGSISGSGGGGSGVGAAAGANGSITTVRNTSDNRFWATLERNIKDILHETDKILPTGAQPAAPQAAPGAPGTTAAPAAPNVSFREAAAVIVNPEAGVVIVRATSRQHEKIQEFLDQVLANVKRQVLIEATIAEVQLNNQYQQGIDWSAFRVRGANSFSGNQVASGSVTTTPTFPPGVTGTPSGAGLPSASGIPNLFTFAAANASIAVALQLLESFGNVRVLSSPKLSVLNNQTALLRVVDNIVYFNVQSSQTSTVNVGSTLSVTTTPVTVPVGFVMNVTPQISDDDTVLLNVKPSTTRLIKFVTDPNPLLVIPNQVPQLRMREMESLIKVNSGQMAVLGGLIEDSVNDIEDTVPIVNSIPILGSLFSSRNRNNTKTELVVFLRPIVVKDASMDGDYRAYRSLMPPDNFTSQPNPGKTAPFSGMK
ncbi:MAG TPA: pilus (MSHA type) biogenesis protein MshL [Burkholderiales bacterium]|nr:pilus (MSHA type) biogenesis protein MshL [Burkholderiales bacterium]